MQQRTRGAENTQPWIPCRNSFLQRNYGLGAEPSIQRALAVVIHGPNFFNTLPVETRDLCLLPLNLAKAMTAPTNPVKTKGSIRNFKASAWFSWQAHSPERSQHPVWSPKARGATRRHLVCSPCWDQPLAHPSPGIKYVSEAAPEDNCPRCSRLPKAGQQRQPPLLCRSHFLPLASLSVPKWFLPCAPESKRFIPFGTRTPFLLNSDRILSLHRV